MGFLATQIRRGNRLNTHLDARAIDHYCYDKMRTPMGTITHIIALLLQVIWPTNKMGKVPLAPGFLCQL